MFLDTSHTFYCQSAHLTESKRSEASMINRNPTKVIPRSKIVTTVEQIFYASNSSLQMACGETLIGRKTVKEREKNAEIRKKKSKCSNISNN